MKRNLNGPVACFTDFDRVTDTESHGASGLILGVLLSVGMLRCRPAVDLIARCAANRESPNREPRTATQHEAIMKVPPWISSTNSIPNNAKPFCIATAAADPRGRGIGEDAGHHVSDRLPHRRRPCEPGRSARGHVHEQGRAGDARARRVAASATTADGVWLSTFHSLCARLLRREAPNIGLSRDFVIYDSSDQVAVVKQAQRELGIDDKLVPPRLALSRISQAKNRMEGPGLAARRVEPARRADREDLRALPAGAQGQQRARLRRPAAEDGRALRDLAAGPRVLRAQVQVRDGRRVPGHEPAAVPAHPPARRGPPQPRGRRRSRSVDLQVARRRPAQHPRLRAATSPTRRSSGSSRTTARRR